MDFFKNRSVAIAIFVAVVIVFSLVGCHISLDKACRRAESAFFDKSLLQTEGYYTCPGDQLEYCVDYANRLLSVIGGGSGAYAKEYGLLRAARLELIDALDSRDIPAISKANQAFTEAVAAVEARHDAGEPLADSHDDYAAIIDGIHGAQAVLDDPAYNDYILAFQERVLEPFPTDILRRLTFVQAPETFP